MASLGEQLRAVSQKYTPQSKAELLASYQKTYGERKGRQLLYARIQEETGASYRSIERRFNPSRLHTPVRLRREKELYSALGEEMTTYSPPQGGYLLSVAGWIKFSQGSVYRSFKVHLVGQAAAAFLEKRDIDILTGAYFANDQRPEGTFVAEDASIASEDVSEGWDSPPDISVSAA